MNNTACGDHAVFAETLRNIDSEVAALEGKLSEARQVKPGMKQELLIG